MSTSTQSFREGDTVELVTRVLNTDDGAETIYSFYGHPRGGKMLTIAIAFALIVIAVGRVRGALALVGVGAAIVLFVTFVLPAILAGKPAIPVAITGAIGIMVIVLYLAHGISHRTTAALFGSIFGILFTAIAGFFATRWLRFTGIASTEDASLLMAAPGLQMSDVLTATIVIAGLGILNDITVAQASAVWEMRELNPHLPKRRIYLSAMRVGRDHIASSIYTLVFAYGGAMLIVLLLLYTYPRDLVDLVTSEQIGQEIIRTLIGAAGLVLSMPVTTAFAVLFARDASSSTTEDKLAVKVKISSV
ncbi:MAG: YibE/F family protein [Leucobacter sp.]